MERAVGAEARILTQANKQTKKETKKQRNKETNKRTNRQPARQTNKDTKKQTNQPTNKQTNKQTNEQTNKPGMAGNVHTKVRSVADLLSVMPCCSHWRHAAKLVCPSPCSLFHQAAWCMSKKGLLSWWGCMTHVTKAGSQRLVFVCILTANSLCLALATSSWHLCCFCTWNLFGPRITCHTKSCRHSGVQECLQISLTCPQDVLACAEGEHTVSGN